MYIVCQSVSDQVLHCLPVCLWSGSTLFASLSESFGHIKISVWLNHTLLAHLSPRPSRWAYSIPMVRHPSVLHFSSWLILIKFYMLHHCSVGWGKSSIWGRSIQNSGFHGNRKHPLTYNGENNVSMLTPSVLIWSNVHVTRTGIKSRMNSNFGHIGPLPLKLDALSVKTFPIDL